MKLGEVNLGHPLSHISFPSAQNPLNCTVHGTGDSTVFSGTLELVQSLFILCIRFWNKKMSERQTKAGNQITLTVSHSLIQSLSTC